MEVARSAPAHQLSRAGPVFEISKKERAAWGVDAQKVVQLMMGQLQSAAENTSSTAAASSTAAGGDDDGTLDLLGAAGEVVPNSRPIIDCCTTGCTSAQFLELDPEQPRLPSDWKKFLDLKTGKMSFVNKTTGVTLDNDPRKQPPLDVPPLAAVLEPAPSSSSSPRAHEFLRSKKYEILREEFNLKASSASSSSDGSPRKLAKRENLEMAAFYSTGTHLWSLQQHEDTDISLVRDTQQLAKKDEVEERSNPKLDLNLTAGTGSPASRQHQEQSVCTMEMVQRALRLTDKGQLLDGKRESPTLAAVPKPSDSPPVFSSLTSSARCEAALSLRSPSTSTSSSAISSHPPRLDGNQAVGSAVLDDCSLQTRKTLPTSVVADDTESKNRTKLAKTATAAAARCTQLVMGACTRCLMYVMLDKSNCKCPRCGSEALVDFAIFRPTCRAMMSTVKRPRVEA